MRIRIISYALVVGIACGTSACHKSDTSQATIRQQQASLYELGVKLRDAIQRNAVDAFADLIFPTTRQWPSVELGEDFVLSREEFVEAMRTRSGHAYAVIFDTQQLRTLWGAARLSTLAGEFGAHNVRSVRDHLATAGDALQIRVGVRPGSAGVPTYGTIHYDWPGKEHTEYVDPIFVYGPAGWSIYTYFNHR